MVKAVVAARVGGRIIKQAAAAIATLVVGAIAMVSAMLGVLFGVAVAVFGSSQDAVASTCDTSWAGNSDVVIPGANGEGQWTLSENEKATAFQLFQGAKSVGATPEEIELVLGAAMQESHLQIYANEHVPESKKYPHHAVGTPTTADGSAVDAIGALQQRPSAGWGEVKDIMSPAYAARAFLGGADGPNKGNPPGLRDQGDLQGLSFAEKIERVQVSGEPEHYAKWEQAAKQLQQLLDEGLVITCGTVSGEFAYPLEDWQTSVIVTDGVGPRDAIAGASTWHPALDLAYTDRTSCGQPVYAITTGKVVIVGAAANGLWIEGADGAQVGYLHMAPGDITVKMGDEVQAGQRIGRIGNEPPSSGCHLDIRIDAAGATAPEVVALPQLTESTSCPTCVHPDDYARLYGVELSGSLADGGIEHP